MVTHHGKRNVRPEISRNYETLNKHQDKINLNMDNSALFDCKGHVFSTIVEKRIHGLQSRVGTFSNSSTRSREKVKSCKKYNKSFPKIINYLPTICKQKLNPASSYVHAVLIEKILGLLMNIKKMMPLYFDEISKKCKEKDDSFAAKKRDLFAVKMRTTKRLTPNLGTTSVFTILAFICLETILLSTMSTCAKTFYMHWNTSNSIFRIDNTDHIIDVNKGNLAFEFDQVHIICPVYEPGTFENETEKYIIYNVSKVEYETCRITNADPRVIAICDKPHKLMFFTITFRPFTPQPGGLEFLPGNDYYFISTSSKDDLYRRIGGRCSTNNMKVVFKVCCASEEKNKTVSSTTKSSAVNGVSSDSNGNSLSPSINGGSIKANHKNSNTINTGLSPSGITNTNIDTNNNVHIKPINRVKDGSIDEFNRIPVQTIGIHNGLGNQNLNGILLTPGHGINMIPNGVMNGAGVGQFPGLNGQTGIRINNIPPQQHYPSHKSANDETYDKHPNEVVKNEELTYNSAASSSPSIHNAKITQRVKSFSLSLISSVNLNNFKDCLTKCCFSNDKLNTVSLVLVTILLICFYFRDKIIYEIAFKTCKTIELKSITYSKLKDSVLISYKR